jgi:hypothetical protein
LVGSIVVGFSVVGETPVLSLVDDDVLVLSAFVSLSACVSPGSSRATQPTNVETPRHAGNTNPNRSLPAMAGF